MRISAKLKSNRKFSFTLIEILLVLFIMGILAGLLYPAFVEARIKAKYTRWFAFNKQCNRDPDCVINFNFQEGSGNILTTSTYGCDKEDYLATDFDGYIYGNYEWTSSGARFGKYKKALRFNGVDTFVDVGFRNIYPDDEAIIPTIFTSGLDFKQDDKFTLLMWAKFDKFDLGDGLFSKSRWGSSGHSEAQYDLYCDPTAGPSGNGSFEVDLFQECVGWDDTDIDLEKEGWMHLALRYSGNTADSIGEISVFVNGKPLGAARATNNAYANFGSARSNFMIGAIGLQTWRDPDGIGYYFQGLIDEFIMYKRALTDGAIEGHYEMGKP